jgi:hypothetical protein
MKRRSRLTWQTRFSRIRELLQFEFPQPQPPAIAAAAVSGDHDRHPPRDRAVGLRHQPRIDAAANAPVS